MPRANPFGPRIIQSLGLAAIALSSAVGIGLLQGQRLNALKGDAAQPALAPAEQAEAESRQRQQLQTLRQVPTFGFRNLVADWVMLQFIQYFGDFEARRQRGYGLSPDYFDIILSRDPYFRDAYLFLSASGTLYAGQPQRTVEIFERELTHLAPTTPERAYVLWRYKGSDELLFLGDAEAAAESFATAAAWGSAYEDPESEAIAAQSQQMAEFLRENPDSRAAQISAWGIVLTNAFDQRTQQLAIQQIEQLGARVEVDGSGQFRIVTPSPR
ncbi:MAG: hypothetical protein ACFB4J_10305 [Elainellaceae cyanobacterium]